jgi:serine/threonine protein kinase
MSDVPERLRSSLAGRYDLQAVVGRGGMATVYRARDQRHDRQVAVKVLRLEVSETIGTERFLREIAIAARLNHPHVLPLLDSGEVDGTLYYVMPLVNGESLRILMQRAGRLPMDRAMEIAGEVAEALAYAHRMGVVHRDIKPENILLLEGHAVVADFGIAKALSSLGARQLTQTGFPIGTPGYMSPEQAAGRAELDERTDVYSLACVFYEMVVGDVPGVWLDEEAVRSARLGDVPAEHRARLDSLAAHVEPALVRALALRRDTRFRTPVDFVEALGKPIPARRRYSNSEVKAIMERAAAHESERQTDTGALTIGGVREIAAEVGLRTRDFELAVRGFDAAARSVDAPTDEKEPPRQGVALTLLGSDPTISLERVVEGEMDATDYPVLVEEIRRSLGNLGYVATLANSLEWRFASDKAPSSGGRAVHITVVPRANRTRIRIEEKLGPIAGGIYGGVVGGGGGGLGGGVLSVLLGATHAGGLVVVGASLAVVGAMYGLARSIFVSLARRRRRQLTKLIDELAEIVADSVNRGPGVRRNLPLAGELRE